MKEDNKITPFLGSAYYPEDWDDCEMEHDISKMQEVGMKVARIGEFAWRKMEPEEGKFDLLGCMKWLTVSQMPVSLSYWEPLPRRPLSGF